MKWQQNGIAIAWHLWESRIVLLRIRIGNQLEILLTRPCPTGQWLALSKLHSNSALWWCDADDQNATNWNIDTTYALFSINAAISKYSKALEGEQLCTVFFWTVTDNVWLVLVVLGLMAIKDTTMLFRWRLLRQLCYNTRHLNTNYLTPRPSSRLLLAPVWAMSGVHRPEIKGGTTI